MSKWLEVALPSPPETLEELSAALIAEGFDSFQTEDTAIILYLPPDAADDLRRLRGLCPGLTARTRDDGEWSEAWKQYYKPTPIGQRLLIQPAWLPPENPEGRAVFLNEPGMSFGTGLHPSTRLCLEILETLDLPGKRVLDVGCGSGILSLCALILGADSAVGVDIDPHAARTATENARLNGVEGRFEALAGDFVTDPAPRGSLDTFDIVFSNIIADVIIPLAPILAPSGALWVASGIIESRLDGVLAVAEECGLSVRNVRTESGWAAVMFGP